MSTCQVGRHRSWPVPTALLGLSAAPVTTGTLRLVQLAGGTQAFTDGLGGAHLGHGVLAADLAKSAGRAVNLAVAEWAVRRSTRSRGTRPATGQPDGAQS